MFFYITGKLASACDDFTQVIQPDLPFPDLIFMCNSMLQKVQMSPGLQYPVSFSQHRINIIY